MPVMNRMIDSWIVSVQIAVPRTMYSKLYAAHRNRTMLSKEQPWIRKALVPETRKTQVVMGNIVTRSH